jgi:coenzyme F420 hydrogenase subunit beta
VRQDLAPATVDRIYEVCPGVCVQGPAQNTVAPPFTSDVVWGQAGPMAVGYAIDPEIRFKASSGGALTALSVYLLECGKVDFILHVAASKEYPMRTERQLSFDRAQILEGAGSRYGPAAPLVDFCQLLDRGRPFAFVGKPCDIAAIRNLAKVDPRVGTLVPYLLTFVCGGESELSLSDEIVGKFGLKEDQVSLLRYRGYGCPGPTRIEAKTGEGFEETYNNIWADEAGWRIQARCKICPDAIGELADIVASDVWPGGAPQVEDAGFNGFMARTRKGAELLSEAARAGAIHLERPMTFRDMDFYQPHQVVKKRAIMARVMGRALAGQVVPRFRALRLFRLALGAGIAFNWRNFYGAFRRALAGKSGEPSA